jgi:serine-type D-Ala-D-Ala endopeptidase (penicillin-binding protein 7)
VRRLLVRFATLLVFISFSNFAAGTSPQGEEHPAELLPQSTDPVLVGNIPQLTQSLPDGIELPPESGTAKAPLTLDPPLQVERDARRGHWIRSLRLSSAAALVVDQQAGRLLYAKNPGAIRPIASITKLMTAIVVLDAGLALDEVLGIDRADVDNLKITRSRLDLGVSLTRREMLKLAMMASENRAAAALARTYPGGSTSFVQAMNEKARRLGMRDTLFLDSSGLNSSNVSTARDLALLVNAAYQYPMIREFTTSGFHDLALMDSEHETVLAFRNTNALLRNSAWEIGLSKTGYISEAGRCLVMQATIARKAVIIILLDARGRAARMGDANQIKHWLEGSVIATRTAVRRRHAAGSGA